MLLSKPRPQPKSIRLTIFSYLRIQCNENRLQFTTKEGQETLTQILSSLLTLTDNESTSD